MIKILGSLIIILSTSVIGLYYSSIYVQRVKQIRQFQYALNMLESEIVFTATPLTEAFIHVSERSEDGIKFLFQYMADEIKEAKISSVYEAFENAYKRSINSMYLKKEEIDIINTFMQSIGSSDIEGQKKNFNITIKKMEEFEKRAEENRNKNERLYKYLGVCSGMIIVIILI